MGNKHTPRDRKPFSRSADEDYKFLGNPLMRKAADKTLTKRRDGSSPGRHGVKSSYPPIVPMVIVPRYLRDRSKYSPSICQAQGHH